MLVLDKYKCNSSAKPRQIGPFGGQYQSLSRFKQPIREDFIEISKQITIFFKSSFFQDSVKKEADGFVKLMSKKICKERGKFLIIEAVADFYAEKEKVASRAL